MIQGQRQIQVGGRFGVHVCTIEGLVTHLWETGPFANRPGYGRLDMTSQRQDSLFVLRSRHLTTNESAIYTIITHNCSINAKFVRNNCGKLVC